MRETQSFGTAASKPLLSSHFLLNSRDMYRYAPSHSTVTTVWPGPSFSATLPDQSKSDSTRHFDWRVTKLHQTLERHRHNKHVKPHTPSVPHSHLHVGTSQLAPNSSGTQDQRLLQRDQSTTRTYEPSCTKNISTRGNAAQVKQFVCR